jgi:hypothetical protein
MVVDHVGAERDVLAVDAMCDMPSPTTEPPELEAPQAARVTVRAAAATLVRTVRVDCTGRVSLRVGVTTRSMVIAGSGYICAAFGQV